MPLDLTRIKALCFDVDGTLSDTDDHMVMQLQRLLLPFQWAFPRRDSRAFARWWVMAIESPGNFVYGLPDRFGLDDRLARLSESLAKRGWGRKTPEFWIIPDVLPSLEKLHTQFPMSVVSARDASGTQAFIHQFQLQPFFTSIVTAQTCEHTKPYPDPVRFACQQMAVNPHNALMVGDTTVDIHAGKSAGLQTVGVLCGFGAERELRRAGADLILPTTADLVDILLKERP